MSPDQIKDLANSIISSAAPQPPVEGLREALVSAKQFIQNGVELGYIKMPDASTPDAAHETLPKIERAIAALASPSLTAGENTKSDGGDVVMCVCCGKPAIGKCEGGLLPKGLFDSAKAAVHREMRAIHEFTGFSSSGPTPTPTAPAPDVREDDPPADLVARFSEALLTKLQTARAKYGYHREAWRQGDWMADCQRSLNEHLSKGDPRDVAAYCAFMWHHGWKTVAPSALSQQPVAVADLEAITPFSVVERTLVEFFSANDVQTEEDGGEWLAYLGIDEEEFSLTGLATAITSALLHPQPAKGER